MDPISESSAGIAFGRFRVLPHRRELLADGQAVKLGGRAFDALMALIETPGAVLSKNALMARVWPDRIVDENNLQAQISALRAVFGPERTLIRTVPGRGYQFTGEIRGQIPLWLGDLETADRSIAQLKDHAEKYSLSGYYAYGSGFEGQLVAKRGNLAVAERLLRSCLESLRQGRSESLYTAFLTDLADVLAKAGRLSESLAAAAEALERAERNDAFWWMPEALRIKGEILLKSNPSDLESIEDCFTRSLACARRQGALSREIRAATSLAQLWQQRGRPADASALLRPIYGRFTEGFETADLHSARTMLESLPP